METSSETIHSIYKSRINLIDILNERGFNVTDYDQFSISDVGLMYTNKQLDLLLENKSKQKIFVKYYLGKTLRPNNIQEIVDDLFVLENILNNNDELLLITKEDMNDSVKAIITQIWNQSSIFVNLISIKRLQFNILKHNMVPKHSILPEEEKDNILKKYGIDETDKLPDISRFDPVASTIGLRPGNICHIIRPSKTAITSDYYRFCYNN